VLKPLMLIVTLTIATLFAGTYFVMHFVHSGGFGLWLGIALAPGPYVASIVAKSAGQLWYFPIAVLLQLLFCVLLVWPFFALRKPINEPK
jgi:hypothetical protein